MFYLITRRACEMGP